MAHGYIVFGDSRRAEERVAFYGPLDLPTTALGAAVTVTIADQTFEAVIINAGLDADGEPSERDELMVLADEMLPPAHVQAAFLANGYSPADRVPPVRSLPHRCEVYVFTGSATEPQYYFRKIVWATDAMVAGQRHVMALEPQFGLTPVTCLAMDNRRDMLPLIAVLIEQFGPEQECQLVQAGWQRVPAANAGEHNFNRLIKVCRAIETQVSYLLSAPLVTGVQVHDDIALDADELAVLPIDVYQEYLAAVGQTSTDH